MLTPRALEQGARLAVAAPASPFVREEFDRGIEEIVRLGFIPVYDESVFARLGYVAGPPELPAAAGQEGRRGPAIAGGIGGRGRCGTAQRPPLPALPGTARPP